VFAAGVDRMHLSSSRKGARDIDSSGHSLDVRTRLFEERDITILGRRPADRRRVRPHHRHVCRRMSHLCRSLSPRRTLRFPHFPSSWSSPMCLGARNDSYSTSSGVLDQTFPQSRRNLSFRQPRRFVSPPHLAHHRGLSRSAARFPVERGPQITSIVAGRDDCLLAEIHNHRLSCRADITKFLGNH
jgi:hypothetical protein